ncbi:MAG: HutD family protein [Hyphomicrobiaceae bacterium]
MLRIAKGEWRESRWLNGQGRSFEIVSEPAVAGPGEPFVWRLAVAEIDRDCAFSVYGAVDRIFTLIEGGGLQLDFASGAQITVARPFEPVAFAGDDAATCRLAAGPCRALNLMVARDRIRPSVEVIATGEPLLIGAQPWTMLVHGLEGQVEIGGQAMATGDTLVLALDTAAALVPDGPSRVLVLGLIASEGRELAGRLAKA